MDAIGHRLVAHPAVANTCTEDGLIEYWSCSVCEKDFFDAEAKREITDEDDYIEPAHHTLAHHDAIPETCTEDGNVEYWDCSVCGKYFTDAEATDEITQAAIAIPAKGHALQHVAAVAAGCEETGNIEHYHCQNCEKDFEDEDGAKELSDVSIAAKGHSWGTPTYEWSADYSSCTAKKVCTSDPAHVVSETVKATLDTSSTEFDSTVLNMTVSAEFDDADFADQSENVSVAYNGQIPLFNSDQSLVKYGLYPHTNISDDVLIAALDELEDAESNGWYLYEGEYYAKAVADSAAMSWDPYHFDNGTEVHDGDTYWFKCEPITWNVLSDDEGECYLLSSILLDATFYDDGDFADNNYENSKVRSWLNADFYDSAFALGNSFVQTTAVDNSAATTGFEDNPHACEDTEDKVFLPSHQDYINPDYGFAADVVETSTRQCRTTDWARARGAYCDNDPWGSYYNNAPYWTRSPYLDEDPEWNTQVFVGRADGEIDESHVKYDDVCVRPAITLSLGE